MEDNTGLDPEAIETFIQFAVTLKKIHVRLVTEGYAVTRDGVRPPVEGCNTEEKPTKRAT